MIQYSKYSNTFKAMLMDIWLDEEHDLFLYAQCK